jgi:hypothetical protein
MIRAFVLGLSVVGTLVFGAAFAVSYTSPIVVERLAREVLRVEVEKRVGERIVALTDSRIADLARKTLGKTDEEYARTKREIEQGVPRRVADAVADFMNADCECRRKLVKRAEEDADRKLSNLGALRERVGGLIESAYASVRDRLLREWRIFTGANAMGFVLLGVLAVVRPGAWRQLLLPAAALLAGAALTAVLYLVAQDWLRTIVLGQYVGFAYLAWFGVAVAFFADILLNKARVTGHIIGSFGPGGGVC